MAWTVAIWHIKGKRTDTAVTQMSPPERFAK